tara:strand:- start:1752 stop:1940 length:189 start_codon:yes stop_codon:yes gene_type:complete
MRERIAAAVRLQIDALEAGGEYQYNEPPPRLLMPDAREMSPAELKRLALCDLRASLAWLAAQ